MNKVYVENDVKETISMDYEEAYGKLQCEFAELASENYRLKQALINVALKL